MLRGVRFASLLDLGSITAAIDNVVKVHGGELLGPLSEDD